jgi:hypothetical protein
VRRGEVIGRGDEVEGGSDSGSEEEVALLGFLYVLALALFRLKGKV